MPAVSNAVQYNKYAVTECDAYQLDVGKTDPMQKRQLYQYQSKTFYSLLMPCNIMQCKYAVTECDACQLDVGKTDPMQKRQLYQSKTFYSLLMPSNITQCKYAVMLTNWTWARTTQLYQRLSSLLRTTSFQ